MISEESYWHRDLSNTADQATRVRDAVNRAIPCLLQEQAEDGRWAGVLSSSPVTTALSLIAMRICDGARLAARIQHGVDWLIAAQNPDGGWGEVPDQSALKSSVLAISALQLIDPVRYRDVIARGLTCLDKMGGWEAVTPAYAPIAALAGLIPWEKTKEMPLELILWPKGLRRKTSFGLSSFLSIGLMRTHHVRLSLWRRPFQELVHRRIIAWLKQAQGSDGSFGETALLNSFVVVALTVAAISGDGVSDMVKRALAFVIAQQQPDGSFQADRDLEVFDTNNATIALAELGYNLKLPRFVRTRDWLLQAQTKAHCFSTDSPPGGWPWATPAGWPDSDDTSYAVKALASLGVAPDAPSMQAGIDWLLRMQNSDGSWSTFVRHSDAPFDQPCPYVTAHVLEGLWATGQFNANSKPVRRAIDWLRHVQRPDGTFTAIWFRNYTCGTASVLEALACLGIGDSPMAQRCVEWLLANQNRDGSWSSALGQPGSAEETGWAISALLNAGVSSEGDTVTRAINWLLEHQDARGGWPASVVGIYAATICYSNTLYPLYYPLKALAVYLRRTRGTVSQQHSDITPRNR